MIAHLKINASLEPKLSSSASGIKVGINMIYMLSSVCKLYSAVVVENLCQRLGYTVFFITLLFIELNGYVSMCNLQINLFGKSILQIKYRRTSGIMDKLYSTTRIIKQKYVKSVDLFSSFHDIAL